MLNSCVSWLIAVLDLTQLLPNGIICLYVYLTFSLPHPSEKSNYSMLSSLKQPLLVLFRAHSNGSIRRGLKTDTSEAVTMRSGLGVNLKDVTVFNRGREKGRQRERSRLTNFYDCFYFCTPILLLQSCLFLVYDDLYKMQFAIMWLLHGTCDFHLLCIVTNISDMIAQRQKLRQTSN